LRALWQHRTSISVTIALVALTTQDPPIPKSPATAALCALLLVALPQPLTHAAAAAATDGTSGSMLDEVNVVGERPGPRLWKVTHGEHVLWVLGTLDHVPKRMTWRSRQVEAAIDQSQELLAAGPSLDAHIGPILAVRLYVQWRGMQRDPDRTRLQDWISPALYARFETLKTRFDAHDGRIEELRPPFAALRLYQHALDTIGLTRTNEIEHTVVAIAERHRIPVEHPQVRVDDPLDTLKQVRALSPASEVDCLETTIQRLETDVPSMRERAVAWASGDVDRLRELPYPNQLEACISDLSASPRVKQLVASASEAWMTAAESALERHRVSFAVRPIYDLLSHDGPLARFRAQGYRIEGP
jgi:uncharacterized protein YbaP (TraB family)